MTIKPTDEMVEAFDKTRGGVNTLGWIEPGLAAVLAIVERDYHVGRRQCQHRRDPNTWCERPTGHEGRHSAEVLAEVTW